MNPGLHDMKSSEYHADLFAPVPTLSSSIAKTLITHSPLHAKLRHPRLNPDYEPDFDDKFDAGTAAHSMLLERDSSKIVWCAFPDWRTKEARELRIETRKQGKQPILVQYKPMLEQMVAVARATLLSSELADILDTGAPEKTMLWEERGCWCKARCDLLSKDRSIILDYKSTTNAEPEAFIRQIARMNYDLQAEFYSRGLDKISGAVRPASRFVFLAQENTAPYACSLISLSNAWRSIGKSKVQRAITLWADCMRTQQWPSYTNQICYAEPAPWMLEEIQSADGGDL